jgi:hypothetical protein
MAAAKRAFVKTDHTIVVRALDDEEAEARACEQALKGVPSHLGTVSKVLGVWQMDDPEVWTVVLITRTALPQQVRRV